MKLIILIAALSVAIVAAHGDKKEKECCEPPAKCHDKPPCESHYYDKGDKYEPYEKDEYKYKTPEHYPEYKKEHGNPSEYKECRSEGPYGKVHCKEPEYKEYKEEHHHKRHDPYKEECHHGKCKKEEKDYE